MAHAVDEDVAHAPEGHRTALEPLRQAVLSAASDADQVIRTGVPAFRHHGKRNGIVHVEVELNWLDELEEAL